MQTFDELSRETRSLIAATLRSRQYYLLTGSGVSLDSSGSLKSMYSASKLREVLCGVAEVPAASSLQQAYSMLTPQHIDEHLTSHYTCSSVGATAKILARFPWRRVYTLNIDDCFERAFSEIIDKLSLAPEALEIINYCDDFQDLAPDVAASIIHLHGVVSRSGEGYVFSHSEYARNMTRPNSWMLTLVQLIRMDPFIISGTSLEEVDVEYYLQQRSEGGGRSDVAPSILVEPYPNKLTERLCDSHGLVLYEGTAIDFLERFEQESGTVDLGWVNPTSDGFDELGLDRKTHALLSTVFERVRGEAEVRPSDVDKFLLGAENSWGALYAGADVPREVTVSLRSEILACASEKDNRVFLLLDEPGSGKTSLLMKVAQSLAREGEWVLWATGNEALDESVCAEILDELGGPLVVFVDNWADHASYYLRILADLDRRDVVFVGAERKYRRAYVESGLADEDVKIVDGQLELTIGEAGNLISRLEDAGLSAPGQIADKKREQFRKSLVGDPISVAACRIQNNFRSFDVIVRDMIRESSEAERKRYVAAAVSRFCFSGGIRRSVLLDAIPQARGEQLVADEAILPLSYAPGGRSFFVPARPVVADRVLNALIDRNSKWVAEIFVDLANALAPRVNRTQIRQRSPESRLSGRLLDYDQIVKRFIDQHAEYFYDGIRERWGWNARYWEQLALLKLDRYLVDRADPNLLRAGVQHARHAYDLERHPLSLTTLAKMLFFAMTEESKDLEELFAEGWELINRSIDVESKWDNIKATAFVVCFKGVLEYANAGGLLSGEQVERLRDVVAITYARRLRDPQLARLREEIRSFLPA